jgi:hypothetical protein
MKRAVRMQESLVGFPEGGYNILYTTGALSFELSIMGTYPESDFQRHFGIIAAKV